MDASEDTKQAGLGNLWCEASIILKHTQKIEATEMQFFKGKPRIS